MPNYAYNYAIKDYTGGAQEKSETRIGGLTKEQQSVTVHHHGPHGYGSGVSQQNTAIVRNSGHGIAVPVIGGLGLGYAGAGIGGLGYAGAGLGYAGAGLGGVGLVNGLGYGGLY